MYDFDASAIPETNQAITDALSPSKVVDATIASGPYDTTLVYRPVLNRMHSSAGVQKAIRDLGLVHLATIDMPDGRISVTFARTRPIYPGFHVLDDCSTRTSVVAMFDGSEWWMPGSELAFPDEMVAREDGTNSSGRFHHVSSVTVPGHAYGRWQVENGRFH